MTTSATIIADSVSPQGIRPITFQLRYPRFIHAEFMTHRALSRNASSSRAVPVSKLIDDIERDPAMPIHWGKNQTGMQAREEILSKDIVWARDAWTRAMRAAVTQARILTSYGVHKQVVNRLLEPFSHINVVCTATDYENFYALRRHEDAQPEIKALADAMWEAQQASTPRLLQPGEWHLPYVTQDDLESLPDDHRTGGLLIKVSVARCARVSYLTHDGRKTTVEEDLALYDRLLGSEPLHASPAEHQATPDEGLAFDSGACWMLHRNQHGNLRGWIQYRKTLPNEYTPG